MFGNAPGLEPSRRRIVASLPTLVVVFSVVPVVAVAPVHVRTVVRAIVRSVIATVVPTIVRHHDATTEEGRCCCNQRCEKKFHGTPLILAGHLFKNAACGASQL